MRQQNLVLSIQVLTLAAALLLVFGCKKEDDKEKTPTVITVGIMDISFLSASCEGDVIDSGGLAVTARGFVFDTIPNPSLDSNLGFTAESSGSGAFAHTLNPLLSETEYFLKAYATYSKGTSYGIELNFTTRFVSFANHILPIFTGNTGCIACHKTGQTPPNLSIENAYNSIVPDLVDLSDPQSSKIYSAPSPASSHPAKYSQSQAALVLKWIEDGARNN